MKLRVWAPSNIALIKYMGKKPRNSSLSWTLPHLRTYVELEVQNSATELDSWEPLEFGDGDYKSWPFLLSEFGRQRFLKHFHFLKKEFGIEESFVVRSANSFPADCGIASSASSFAALTLAAFAWSQGARESFLVQSLDPKTAARLAVLSSLGSGSSGRSFFSPWCEWTGDSFQKLEVGEWELIHDVFVLSSDKKLVSSSEAHVRVASSPNFLERAARAEKRLESLVNALREKNWRNVYQISLEDSEDMHDLFSTSEPSFSYKTEASLSLLNLVRELWQQSAKPGHSSQIGGPVVTMDAGPNVHLLWLPEQKLLRQEFLQSCGKTLPGSILSSTGGL